MAIKVVNNYRKGCRKDLKIERTYITTDRQDKNSQADSKRSYVGSEDKM
jgi:hypothetical protein